jgi:RNA polymerase sigma factor (sigma-70 family)
VSRIQGNLELSVMPASDGWSPNADLILDPKIAALVRRKSHELARSLGFSASDQEDIEQELMLHLVRKFARFDPTRASPVTFASRVIKNKAASMARAAQAQKRTCRRCRRSLNSTIDGDDGSAIEFGATLDESAGRRHLGQRRCNESAQAQLRIDVAEAKESLSLTARQVAALLSHVPEYAASEVLGMSRRETAALVAEIRSLFEARGLCA